MNFNPRSRERSDVTALGPVLIIIDFNPRSRERSDSSRVNLCLQSLHFNPRSRERSDYAGWNAIEIFYISIHAPARGATTDDEIQEQWCSISIHAPARGATIKRQVNPSSFTISIHAPARGATRFCSSCCCATDYFNPRSRERSDFYLFFNVCHSPDFNPRSRERSDTA